MNKLPLLKLAFIITQLLFTFSSSYASTIIQAVGVSSNATGETEHPLINLINQEGLANNYVSGVTDFDSFTATTTVDLFTGIGGVGVAPPVNFDFDMGGLVTIDAIALWAIGSGSSAVVNFDLVVSNLSDFSTSTTISSFAMVNADLPQLANIFTFSATEAQYVRLAVTSNQGFPIATRLNEFAARSSVVPVPAAVWLFSSGLLGLIGIAKRYGVRSLRDTTSI